MGGGFNHGGEKGSPKAILHILAIRRWEKGGAEASFWEEIIEINTRRGTEGRKVKMRGLIIAFNFLLSRGYRDDRGILGWGGNRSCE